MSGLSRSSHALVTGGGRGIGREIASSLVQAGATVTVLGRNRKALDDLVAAGVAHGAVIADVADQAAMNAANLARDHGLRSVEVRVSGPGSGRESAIRALAAAGIEVRSIKDATPIPHNGCRPPKRRRV